MTARDWRLASPRWAEYAKAMWDKYKVRRLLRGKEGSRQLFGLPQSREADCLDAGLPHAATRYPVRPASRLISVCCVLTRRVLCGLCGWQPNFPWDADMFAFNMALLSVQVNPKAVRVSRYDRAASVLHCVLEGVASLASHLKATVGGQAHTHTHTHTNANTNITPIW